MGGRVTLIQALQAGAHWRKGSYASSIETDFQVSNKVTPGNCLRGEGYSYTSITGWITHVYTGVQAVTPPAWKRSFRSEIGLQQLTVSGSIPARHPNSTLAHCAHCYRRKYEKKLTIINCRSLLCCVNHSLVASELVKLRIDRSVDWLIDLFLACNWKLTSCVQISMILLSCVCFFLLCTTCFSICRPCFNLLFFCRCRNLSSVSKFELRTCWI